MEKREHSRTVGGNVSWCSHYRKQYAAAPVKSLQSCLTLCDPKDGSPPGSSVHGIFQARVLKRGAIALSIENSMEDPQITRVVK